MAERGVGGAQATKAEQIAQRQQISLTYLHDILGDLNPDGGFTLAKPAASIAIADVFRAIDGPLADVHDESLRTLGYPAPAAELPELWMAIRGSLRRVLETVSVADLVAGTFPEEVSSLAAEYRRSTAERFGH